MCVFPTQVSATFAASLVTSPALGAYLQDLYSETVVIWIATAVALLDVLFIMVAVPESLPEKLRPASWGSAISWEKADPFGVSVDRGRLRSPGVTRQCPHICCNDATPPVYVNQVITTCSNDATPIAPVYVEQVNISFFFFLVVVGGMGGVLSQGLL